MITLYKLRVFVSVAQAGSFSRAAKAMFLTQSAVSQQIHALEAGLGVQLFARRHRGVQLTEAGERLLTYAEKILWLVGTAESEVMEIGNLDTGKLLVGATPVASVYLVPSWVKHFSARYPRLTVSVQSGTTSQIAAQIRSQTLALGIVEGNPRNTVDLKVLPLRNTRLWLVVSAQHPWAQKKHISIRLLDEAPLVARPLDSHTRVWMDSILQKYQIRPRIVAEFDDPQGIKKAVMDNLGISILPHCMVKSELEAGHLCGLAIEEIPLERELKALWNAHFPLNPLAQAFLDVVRDDTLEQGA